MALTVTILGSGTSAGVPMIGCHCAVCRSDDPRDRRTRTSIVVSYDGPEGVRHNILVDTAQELRLQAVREGLDLVSAIVYTHAHADHIFGLDDVRRYNTTGGQALPLYAAPRTMETLRRVFPYAFEVPPACGAEALYRPELVGRLIEGPFELLGRTWEPLELPHGRAGALGFRIGDFAYCTDCQDVPAAARRRLEGLDTLVIDALRPRPHPAHLSFAQALAVIAEVRPRRAFFTHLAHDLKHADIEAALPAHVRVAYDGLKLEIAD